MRAPKRFEPIKIKRFANNGTALKSGIRRTGAGLPGLLVPRSPGNPSPVLLKPLFGLSVIRKPY